jgi:hypothetical protein
LQLDIFRYGQYIKKCLLTQNAKIDLIYFGSLSKFELLELRLKLFNGSDKKLQVVKSVRKLTIYHFFLELNKSRG